MTIFANSPGLHHLKCASYIHHATLYRTVNTSESIFQRSFPHCDCCCCLDVAEPADAAVGWLLVVFAYTIYHIHVHVYLAVMSFHRTLCVQCMEFSVRFAWFLSLLASVVFWLSFFAVRDVIDAVWRWQFGGGAVRWQQVRWQVDSIMDRSQFIRFPVWWRFRSQLF